MLLYYGIFFIIAVASFLELYGLTRRDAFKLYVIFCFSLCVMSFIRWQTGTDWESYESFFQIMPPQLFWEESHFEVGYTFLNGLAKIVSSDFTVLLLLCGVIIFSFQSRAIYKLSPYPLFTLLFWWGINYAGVFFVRQTIAVAILFFSVIYIKERRFWPFFFCVVLAMFFHRTSFLFIIAYWLFRWKISPMVMVIGIFIAIAFAGVVDALMNSLGALVGGVLQVKISEYTGELRGESFGVTQSLPVIIAKAFFSKFSLIILSLIMLKKIEKQSPEFRGYLNIFWAGVLLFLMTVTIGIALTRMSAYFDILQIILLPYIIKSIDNKNMRILVVVLSFIYIALRLYTVTTGGYYDFYVPYKTIFD